MNRNYFSLTEERVSQFVSPARRYLYLLSLTFRFLAMVGLIQFGPRLVYRSNVVSANVIIICGRIRVYFHFHRTMFVRQSLIFVNRKATLLDTRSCPPGYSRIDTNINYPIHRYELKSLSDIETYWSDAMRFALGTKLGKSKKWIHLSMRSPRYLTRSNSSIRLS